MAQDENAIRVPNPNLQAPPMPTPPGSSLGAALKEAAIGAAVVAAFAAISTKIPLLNKIFSRGMKREAMDAAVIGGVVGGLVGYSDNETARNVTYPLQVENTLLKEQIVKMDHEKSFAQRVAEEKMQEQATEHTR